MAVYDGGMKRAAVPSLCTCTNVLCSRTNAWLALAIVLCSCTNNSPANQPPGPTDPAALVATLNDLAALGEKRVGTDPGAAAGEYVRNRMAQIGLVDVH